MWHRVTRANPCPICQHPDWCTISGDGTACCMRTESKVKATNGGWMHFPSSNAVPVVRHRPNPPMPKPHKNWTELLSSWFSRCESELAEAIGVTTASLRQLEAHKMTAPDMWAFPMRNGENEIIGIRTRNSATKEKKAILGSRSGIFIPQGIPPQDPMFIAEGPTDTAAVLSLGFYCVGRADCNSGGDHIKAFIARKKIRRCVIISDSDNPGLNGAEKLAIELGIICRIIVPPAKDIREFYTNGGTKTTLNFLINQQKFKKH